MRLRTVHLACLLAAAVPVSAAAHPHAFIDASLTAIFDNEGRLTGVHEEWAFDNGLGDSLRLQADTNRDEALDEAELKGLSDLIRRTLGPYGFYTQVVTGGQAVALGEPVELVARVEHYRVKVGFTLPLVEPVATRGAGIDVFDSELNFAIAFVSPPVQAVNLPAGCTLIRRDRIPGDPAWQAFMTGEGSSAAVTPDPAQGSEVRAILRCL